MVLRIKTQSISVFVALVLLFLYAFTIGLTSYIYPISIALPFSFILALLLIFFSVKRGFSLTKTDLWVLILCAIVLLFNNADLSQGKVDYCIYTVTFIVAFVFLSKFDDWIEIAFKLLTIIGLFYATMTYVTAFSPSFFNNVVYKLMGQSINETSILLSYSQGYYCGFTPNIGTNAMYLVSCVTVPLSVLLTTNKKNRILIIFLVLYMYGALLATGKRAPFVFTIVAFLVAYYYLNANRPIGRFFKIVVFVSIAFLILYLLSEYLPFLANVIKRWGEVGADYDSGRSILRLSALEYFKKNPMIGIGWDGFKYTYSAFQYVHCVYLQLLCEVGIIGAAPFIIFFIIQLWNVIRIMIVASKRNANPKVKTALFFSLFYQVYFLTTSLVSNCLYDPTTLLLYIMACSIGEYYYRTGIE